MGLLHILRILNDLSMGKRRHNAVSSYIRILAVNGIYAGAVQAISLVALWPNDIKEGVMNESFS